jgi:hypothetical protein
MGRRRRFDTRQIPPAADPGSTELPARRPVSARLAPWLIGLILLFAIAGAVSASQRSDWLVQAAKQAGLTPWPGGNDGDILLVWTHDAGQSMRLVALDGPGIGTSVIALGFAVWMSLIAWLLRQTFMPYMVTVASLALSLLVTGGIRGHGALPQGLVVDARRASYADDGPAHSLCAVRAFTVERRNGAKGGPSWWVVAHPAGMPPADLTVFDAPAPAEYLRGQLQAFRRKAACPSG